MKKALKLFLPTAGAIARLLHPYAEVVVHDIALDQVAAIYNPFSKRRVGDPSLLTKEEMTGLENCLGPYEKLNWDGRKLKSVSAIIRDVNNKAVGLFCVNLDISKLETFSQLIHTFINNAKLSPQPIALFQDDWQERINKYVNTYLMKHHLTLESLTRSETKALIDHLHSVGAFTAKKAAVYIARILGVSRATIYNYLALTEDN